MAGVVAITEEVFSHVKKVTFAWTSDAAGAADGQTAKAYTGKVEALVTVPAGGGVQPTDLYDAIVKDEDNVDVLAAAGQNRSNATTQQVLAANLGVVANDKLTLNVTNAGNAKQGTLIVHIR